MHALLIVKILCFKNRALQMLKRKKDCCAYLILIIFPYMIFTASEEIFNHLVNNPRFDLIILSKITSSLFFALSIIVIVASIIASIGNLYTAKDLNLLLTLPIKKRDIFYVKFISIFLESSWTIFLFLIPILFSFAAVLNLPLSFYLLSVLVVLALTLCSCSAGMTISCFAVNRFGPKACIESIVIIMSVVMIYLMIFTNSPSIGSDKNSIEEIISYFSKQESTSYAPHKLAGSAIASYWDSSLSPVISIVLFAISFLAFLIAGICYEKIPVKIQKIKIRKNKILNKIYLPILRSRRYIIKGTLAAFMSKENKTILRDLSQASQFLILVFVTFVYLLNFQQLKNKPDIDPDSIQLWYTLLAVSNISLGSCVLTAIATRFVFPSISMEGKCFNLLKSAPLRIYDIVFYKFTTWLIPFTLVAIIVLVAGALAIDANYLTLAFTAFIAINLSFALVATAIGTGAKYARFDWDSPTQVATGFGSLILMLKSLFIVLLYIVLATIPMSIFCIGDIQKDHNLVMCLLISMLTIMTSAILVRDNLKQGAIQLSLQE